MLESDSPNSNPSSAAHQLGGLLDLTRSQGPPSSAERVQRQYLHPTGCKKGKQDDERNELRKAHAQDRQILGIGITLLHDHPSRSCYITLTFNV